MNARNAVCSWDNAEMRALTSHQCYPTAPVRSSDLKWVEFVVGPRQTKSIFDIDYLTMGEFLKVLCNCDKCSASYFFLKNVNVCG